MAPFGQMLIPVDPAGLLLRSLSQHAASQPLIWVPVPLTLVAKSPQSRLLDSVHFDLRATFHKYRPSSGTSGNIDFAHILL